MRWDWTPETRAKLAMFLEVRGLTRGDVTTQPIGDGHSNLTFLVSDGSRQVVVRRPPPPPTPPGAHDMLREARLVGALAGTAVPVPRLLATAGAGEVIDVPFYVMSFTAGPVVTTGTPPPLDSPARRRRIGRALADTLADLHAVDWRSAGLADLGRPEGFNERHRRRIGALVADDDGKPPPHFAQIDAWLAAHVPAESGASIIHNDYRIGNVILSAGRPGEIAAVLDWELATLGDPLLDVGYFLASVPEPGDPLTPTEELGVAMLESGYPTRQELADRYAERTGANLANLDWYTALALWKLAVLYEYGRRRAVRGVGDPYYTDPALVWSFLQAAHRAAGLPSPRTTPGGLMESFHDELVRPGVTDLPERFFDRFVFNLHRTDATTPSIIFGLGIHPLRDTVDGFAILTTRTEQRNVRFATELSATDASSCGPLSWQVVEPMTTWHVALGPNPTRLQFDLTWRARTPAWYGDVTVTNSGGETTSFEHLFQSGRYDGTLAIDGAEERIGGWYGQRDRSRGVRTMSGGQGLHIWYQVQFPDRSIGFLIVENRAGGRLMLEGAVMHTDGGLDPVVDVRHDLKFDHLDLRSGTVEVTTEAGTVYTIGTDASAGGALMAGGGYGGHHGKALGRDHLESDVYPLDGTVTQLTLDSSLTDRLATFDWDGTPGIGIFEFALTRSRSYSYRPTLAG